MFERFIYVDLGLIMQRMKLPIVNSISLYLGIAKLGSSFLQNWEAS